MSTLTVIGAGNSGSHLLPLLARMPEIKRIRVVDRDRYEAKNLASQQIVRGDVGRPKAVVQAGRLRGIRPELEVEPVVAAVENVPLGRLRAQLLIACLDSRRARQRVNEAAWRLGVPWIDAGVRPAEMLVRVSVLAPGPEAACMECAWSDRDYELLERVDPCQNGPAAESTDAPAALGALAAALAALAGRRILAGDLSMAGKELVMDAGSHRLYNTVLTRNQACRFDHQVWPIEGGLTAKMTVNDALQMGTIAAPGKYFTRTLICGTCGRRRNSLKLTDPAGFVSAKCRRCGARLQAPGFELLERLDDSLPARLRCLPLAAIGVRPGEIVAAGDRYLEVG